MRTSIWAALLLLPASGVRAQMTVASFAPAPLAIAPPAAFSAAAIRVPALAAPALAAPALFAVSSVYAAAAPALARIPAAAASAPGRAKTPSAEHGAAALSEFSRLVADLMSADPARSGAAAAELNKLKDAHLNTDPEPEKTRILDLKPMQIPAGMYEVQQKARALRDMKSKDADEWLREKSAPYIEDYKGRKRPVDHHHEARAAWEADYDKVYAHRYFDAQLHRKIKGLSRDEFYAVTRAMGLFYDRDQFGTGPHDPNHLPEDVRGLADDPYRSVAWQVRERGGYNKSPVPFAEFRWAQFFRQRLKTYPTRADFEKAVVEAMALVHDPAARRLPGYKPRPVRRLISR